MSKNFVHNSVTAKLERSSMSSHSSSKNKFKAHRYIMMTQVLLCELNPTLLDELDKFTDTDTSVHTL